LEFDGDCTKGKAFLTSCWTYIRLCLEAFEDDTIKIIWAMSYMKSRWASRWAAREFEYEAAPRDGRLRFLDWVDFEDEFHKDFVPLNAEATAMNILEMSIYFQGKWMVDDYLDQFHDLVYDSRYTDPKTIMVKFHQGLDQWISAALAGMASG
jgi:serine protease inhibitor